LIEYYLIFKQSLNPDAMAALALERDETRLQFSRQRKPGHQKERKKLLVD